MLNTIESYTRIKIHIEKANTKFFIFTPKCAKTKTFLLKGLPADTETKEIMDELRTFESDNFLKFIKVTNFSTARSKKETYCLPLFLIQISSKSQIKSMISINTII